MDVKEILKHVDHTLLKQTATWEDIKQICDDGIKYGCASVCIPQTYVNHAAHYVAEQQHYGFGQLPICTVIGFPNGYNTPAVKAFEAAEAIRNGADEVDKNFNGIKGGGAALLWEKIVATNSNKIVWIVDESKVVDTIGKFPLPVEVIPFGAGQVVKKFEAKGYKPVLRLDGAGAHR